MLQGFLAHLRHNVVAYLALFVALGGTTYAAARWTGEDVVDASLTGADIRDASITGDDVLESSLDLPAADEDAETLDGLDSTDFLGATAKAADADKLDGKDATAFGAPNTWISAFNGDTDVSSKAKLAEVSLPAGNWLVIGKTTIAHTGAGGAAECVLEEGLVTIDRVRDHIAEGPTTTPDPTESVSLTALRASDSATTVEMSCDGPAPSMAEEIKLIAVRLDG